MQDTDFFSLNTDTNNNLTFLCFETKLITCSLCIAEDKEAKI